MICDTCWGEGFIVTCCDDICNGLGYCMHGDGETMCPDCRGEGEIPGDEDEEEADEWLHMWADYPSELLAGTVAFDEMRTDEEKPAE